MDDLQLMALGFTCVLVVPVAILAVVALVRTFRINELERRIGKLQAELAERAGPPQVAASPGPAKEAAIPAEVVTDSIGPATASPVATSGAALEMAIGGKLLGWVAAVLVIFGTSRNLKTPHRQTMPEVRSGAALSPCG